MNRDDIHSREDFREMLKEIKATAPPPRDPPRNLELQHAEERLTRRRQLSREFEALNLYEPLPMAAEFHQTNTLWRLLGGSNRCLAGEQKIYDPVQNRYRQVENIKEQFHVLSINPHTGKCETRKASRPFIKGYGTLYRFTLSSGEVLSATLDHCVVGDGGRWLSLRNAITFGIPLAGYSADAIHRRVFPRKHSVSSVSQQWALSSSFAQAPQLGFHIDESASGRVCEPQFRYAEDASAQHSPRIPLLQQFLWQIVSGRNTKFATRRDEGASPCVSRLPRGYSPAPVLSTLDSDQLARDAGVRHCQKTPQDCLDGYLPCRHLCGEQPRRILDTVQESVPSQGDAREHIRWCLPGDDLERSARHNQSCQLSRLLSIPDVPVPVMDRCRGVQFQTSSSASKLVCENNYTSFQWREPTAVLGSTTDEVLPHREHSDAFVSSHPPLFHGINSSVNCIRVECLGQGPIWDISVEPHANYVAAGLINANSGKTLAALVEAAWAMTGTHPYGFYPATNTKAMFVGLKWSHVSQLYLGLFTPGLFKVIQDEHTRRWRAVRYDRDDPTRLQGYDEAYREKWRDAPPLIPPRWLKGRIAWESGTKDCPSVIHLINVNTSYWYSALGEPERGRHYNFVLFDEEMPDPQFYEEAHRGLTRISETHKQQPKGVWPATAQVANPELAELREKADADPKSKLVRQFEFRIAHNPYIAAEARQMFREGLSEDARAVRYDGIPEMTYRRVYPMFNVTDHTCEPFEIPDNYTRYFYLDPSRRHNATILVAVDPDERYMIVYDGFDIPGNSEEWATELKQRQGEFMFECGVCDQQMGKNSNVGLSNKPVAQQYFEAAMQAGIKVRIQGPLNGFFPGCNKVADREVALISAMAVRGAGPHEATAKLKIFRGMFPELEKQIKRAHTDPKRPTKRHDNPHIPSDWIDTLEYCAAHNPTYRQPQRIEDDTLENKTPWDVYQEHVRYTKARDKARRRVARV